MENTSATEAVSLMIKTVAARLLDLHAEGAADPLVQVRDEIVRAIGVSEDTAAAMVRAAMVDSANPAYRARLLDSLR